MQGRIDRIFLLIVLVLLGLGFLLFTSASLGLIARENVSFADNALTQLFAIGIGLVLMVVAMRIPLQFLKKMALPFFCIALFITSLTLVPGIGQEANGATRWLAVFGFSFQPSELLKCGAILLLASMLAKHRAEIGKIQYGLLPYLGVVTATGMVLYFQPDNDTLLIIGATLGAMYLAAGARIRDIAILLCVGIAAATFLVITRPYIAERITTFLNPHSDPWGSGWQLQQSLIAIGSGEWFGRGFGQSVQKFSYLPEPIGDSIFSVVAEEFGFVGSVVLLLLFFALAYRGLHIAERCSDFFGGLVALGLVILIVSQSLLNIGSMVGLVPLTGLPLMFISKGGTAMMVALFEVGLILNTSRYKKQ